MNGVVVATLRWSVLLTALAVMTSQASAWDGPLCALDETAPVVLVEPPLAMCPPGVPAAPTACAMRANAHLSSSFVPSGTLARTSRGRPCSPKGVSNCSGT